MNDSIRPFTIDVPDAVLDDLRVRLHNTRWPDAEVVDDWSQGTPLAYAREKDIAEYAELREFPIIPCNLCGSQENLQRQVIKEMLQGWDKTNPGRIETMFRALCNVVPSHLADHQLFDFKGLQLGFPHGIVPGADTIMGPLDDDEETGANGSGVQMMEKIDILSL